MSSDRVIVGLQPPPSEGLASVASRNAMTAVLARTASVLVAMILTPYVLHRLGRESYGVAVAAGSAFEYLSLLRGGMGAALRRYVTVFHHADEQEKARRYYAAGFWWAGVLRGGILILGIFLAGPFCQFLRLPASQLREATIGVALILAAAVVTDASTMLEIPIYATGRTARLSMLRMVLVWLRPGLVVLGFTLLVANLGVYGGALAISELLCLLAVAWMVQRSRVVGPAIPRVEFGDSPVRRELFRYGGFALLYQLAALLYISSDNLMIGRIYGVGAVTHYSLGTRWSPLILGFLVTSLSSLTPLFTQLETRGESERSKDALCRVVAVTSALAVSMCLVPCVVGDLFLLHWVGPEYRSSAVYLIAMLVPSTLEAALAPVWMALTARGRIGWIATGQIIVAVGNVGLSLLLALVFGLGLLGFALGNTIALLAKNLLLIPLARRDDHGLPPAREFLRPLPLALAGGAPALLALYLMRPLFDGNLGQVVAAGLLGGALCLTGAMLAALGRDGTRALLRGILRPGPPKAGGPRESSA